MARVQAIRKKTRMPPKMPKVGKGPQLPNFKTKLKPAPRPARVYCKGGPWHGECILAQICEPTMVFTLKGMRGRYKPSHTTVPVTGKHHTVDVSVYDWQEITEKV